MIKEENKKLITIVVIVIIIMILLLCGVIFYIGVNNADYKLEDDVTTTNTSSKIISTTLEKTTTMNSDVNSDSIFEIELAFNSYLNDMVNAGTLLSYNVKFVNLITGCNIVDNNDELYINVLFNYTSKNNYKFSEQDTLVGEEYSSNINYIVNKIDNDYIIGEIYHGCD